MIIPVFRSPKKYVEQKCSETELVSVDYKVEVIISFKEKTYYKPVKSINGNTITLSVDTVTVEAKRYKLGISIQLSGREYEKNVNRHNEEEYVGNKVKNSDEFKERLNELLFDMPEDVEYEIETRISLAPDGLVKNTRVVREWTEYVAVY